MHRGERGSTSVEYAGVFVVIGALMMVLATTGVGGKLASALTSAICEITRSGSCQTSPGEIGTSESGATRQERIDHLEDNARRRRTVLQIEGTASAGSHFARLHAQIREALAKGQVEKAEQLDATLEMYIRLARGNDLKGSERGGVIEDLWASDAKWRESVEHGTRYLPPNGDNARFFDIPAAPGEGSLKAGGGIAGTPLSLDAQAR